MRWSGGWGWFIAAAVAVVAAFSASAAGAQSVTARPVDAAPLRIGIVENPDDFDGWGCRFQLAYDHGKGNNRYIFLVTPDEEGVLNVDGADARLIRVGFDAGDNGRGDRFTDRYRKDDLEVRLDLTVTKRCDPSPDSCELTLYDALITVIRGAARRTLTAKGFCGG